jgi:23S rRNA pseudouridine1911/1915/1917 synthase
MPTKDLVVDAPSAGSRVDAYLVRALGLSRAKVKALFEARAVRIQGRAAKKGQMLSAGDAVKVELREVAAGVVAQPEAPLRFLHEDDALIFVDKPAGWPSHPLEPNETGTVGNALIARHPECEQASLDPRECGLCHRLDAETSGVLLAARTRDAWTAMRAAFSKREVDKRYWAVVTGPIADQGEVTLPLRHHPRRTDRVEPAASGGPGTREALTTFQVLSRAGEASLLEAKIETGVLHQVRAHLAAIGAPILGDPLYGGRADPELKRFFLHARALGVRHPSTGLSLSVSSPLPPELVNALARLGLAAPSEMTLEQL